MRSLALLLLLSACTSDPRGSFDEAGWPSGAGPLAQREAPSAPVVPDMQRRTTWHVADGGGDADAGAATCEIAGCGPSVAPAAEVSLPALFVGPDTAWVAGPGTIGRKVGDDDWCWCQRDPAEVPLASWGAADDDVWFVGTGGWALHHDGASFTRVDLGTTEDLHDVWGTGPADVWVVGRGGVVRHFDGTTWSDLSVAADETLRAVWGTSTGDVWIAGSRPALVPEDPVLDGASAIIYRRDAAASRWNLEMEVTAQHGFAGVRDVHGVSATDVWAIGSDHPAGAACSISAAWHSDGTAWTRVSMDLLDECRDFSDVEAGAPGAEDGVWIGGEDDGGDPGTLRFTGGAWSVDRSPTAHALDRIDRHGDRMFATGGTFDNAGFHHKIVRWTGDAWTIDW